jgi:hypothetical protein
VVQQLVVEREVHHQLVMILDTQKIPFFGFSEIIIHQTAYEHGSMGHTAHAGDQNSNVDPIA